MIGIVTDSNSQIAPTLVERYAIEVVPLTVVLDGIAHLEGVDLSADDFYARFGDTAPDVSTGAPSPGQFVEAYRGLAARGCDEILSVHVGSALSGTLASARIAADLVAHDPTPLRVRLVDTATASFGIACCVWEAAIALDDGADLEEAATVAEAVAPTVGNVFVVTALDLARAGGRVVVDAPADGGIPVLTLEGAGVRVLATVVDVEGAAAAMAAHVRRGGPRLRVAVGIADAGARPVSAALEAALASAPEVVEVVRYRVGPSVGVHTGPGTAGAFFHPVREAPASGGVR